MDLVKLQHESDYGQPDAEVQHLFMPSAICALLRATQALRSSYLKKLRWLLEACLSHTASSPAGGLAEPPEEMPPGQLIPLPSFKAGAWHLGDRAVLVPEGQSYESLLEQQVEPSPPSL